MEYDNLKNKIIPDIKNYLHDWGTVLESYKDILNIYSVANSIDKHIGKDNCFQLIDKGKYKQASLWSLNQNKIISLLKALYLFTNIYVNRFLIEITNDTKITLLKFVHCEKWAKKFLLYKNIDPSKILSVYCIVIFRHKLLAHHDIYRGEGAVIDGMMSYLHFFGISNHSTGFPPSEVQKLQELKNKYINRFDDLSSLTNNYQISEYLFYNIPIDVIGGDNIDRKNINKIIEISGVKSYDFQNIINSIDEFTYEFVRVLKHIKNK